jgi:ABC-type transport system substrate-binding protein
VDVYDPHALIRALALAASVSLASCSGADGVRTQDGTMLVLGHSGDAVTLDPPAAHDPSSRDVTTLVFVTLVRAGARPGIATRWSVASDGATWTFHVPARQRFSDGTPLDAVAVAYNVVRWQRARSAAGTAVRAVRTPDAQTVQIVLRKARTPLLGALAAPEAGIAAPGSGAGSGPYEVASWERSDAVTLRRNPYYAGPAPRYATVVVRNVPDQATGPLALEKKDIDALLDPGPAAVAQFAADPAVAVYRDGRRTIVVSAAIGGVTARDGTILTADHWSRRRERLPVLPHHRGRDPGRNRDQHGRRDRHSRCQSAGAHAFAGTAAASCRAPERVRRRRKRRRGGATLRARLAGGRRGGRRRLPGGHQ